MKARSSIVVLSVLLALCVLPVNAQTVQNPSFETHNALSPDANGPYNLGPVPNWVMSGSGIGGSVQPSTTLFPNGTPDGITDIWTNSLAFSQDEGTVVANPYLLTVNVGIPSGYTGAWQIALQAGTAVLCSLSSANVPTITPGTFAQESLSCNVPAGDLTIALSGTGTSGQRVHFASAALAINNQHSVTLNWQPSTTQGVTYNVYRSNGATWNPVLLANVSTTSYTDSTIVLGNSYVYKVTAFLAAQGESEFPSPVTVVTQ